MVASVLVELSNRNIDKCYNYLIPKNFETKVKVGIRVIVPFGRQILEGFVLNIFSQNSNDDLKEIINIIDTDVILNEELLDLGKYIKDKTLSTLISAYQTMLPKALKAQKKTLIKKAYDKYIELNFDVKYLDNYKFNESQKKIINSIINGVNSKKILKSISNSSLNTLINKNIVKEVLIEKYRLNISKNKKYKKVCLNTEQQQAVNKIMTSTNVCLLYGVTGSGKTEVYMEVIDKILNIGKTAIVLVPEISLTPQITDRFSSRFGNNIAILHSRLNEGEKYDEYRKIAKGEVSIVIGARSAIFAPLKNIGVIIVDEEHSNTYKQENKPKYNAIDIAIERAKYHNAKVILGSATPSLESFSRTIANRYQLVQLKRRANDKDLPNVLIVDMNKEAKKNNYFSSILI